MLPVVNFITFSTCLRSCSCRAEASNDVDPCLRRPAPLFRDWIRVRVSFVIVRRRLASKNIKCFRNESNFVTLTLLRRYGTNQHRRRYGSMGAVVTDPLGVSFGSDHIAWASCGVLVIDDDQDIRAEYCEILDSLGYAHRSATDAGEALKLLAEDQSLGIVVTDLQMPGMNGVELLEEISVRFAGSRPIVALVITGFGSLETAVQAMRHAAVDFVQKPVGRKELTEALRRASVRRNQLLGRWQIEALQKAAVPADQQGAAEGELAGESLIEFVRNIMSLRRKRLDFIDPSLFADPAWDILLELTLAKLENTPIPTSSACAATQVPFSTAFRCIGQLVDAGLVRRWKDPQDNRRALLELEEETFDAMTRYLSTIRR